MKKSALKVLFVVLFGLMIIGTVTLSNQLVSHNDLYVLRGGVEDDPEPEFVYPDPVHGGVEDDPEPEFVYPGQLHGGVEDDPEPEFVYPDKLHGGVEDDPEPEFVYPFAQ